MNKLLLSCACLMGSLLTFAQISAPPNGGNQKSIVRQYIGALPFVEVVYNSPDVTGPNGQSRKGQIWGGLVPYGFNSLGFGLSTPENPSPWRAGANENTTIEFSHDMMVEGEAIAAGKYGLHIAPAQSGPWTVIFSKDNNHWGSYFYRPENDVLRIQVEPMTVSFTEWLTYDFIDRQPTSTTLALKWEEKGIPFKIEVPNSADIHVAHIQSELNNSLGFTFIHAQNAATYALSVGKLDKALEWADKATSDPFSGVRNFGTLQTKAAVLRAMGKNDEAFKIMDEAIKLEDATVFAIHAYGRQLIAAGKKEEALAVFKYNQKRYEGAWPTNYGLARAYSAMGDYKKAIEHLKVAKTKVPSGDTINPPLIDQNIAKLEKGEDIN